MSTLNLHGGSVLRRKDAAKVVRVSLSVLDKYNIPCVRMGRRVLYRYSILRAWLEDQERSQTTGGGAASYEKLMERAKEFESLAGTTGM